MPNKNFLLLSLEDTKIKKVSNVISNDSCRKILDYLSNKEATESELAERLQLPISTVHYNLQQLMETGLISAEEYHYSSKGKEVSHYKIANKYIIIAPKKAFGIKEKLKSILPVALIVVGAAGAIQLINNYLLKRTSVVVQGSFAKSAETSIAAAPLLEDTASATQYIILPQNIAAWFLVGALFTLIVYLIVSSIKKDIH